jgi:hypothetical protein
LISCWASPDPLTGPAARVPERVREEGGGNVYSRVENGMEGWLCPALLKYFGRPPEKLFIQIKASG